MRMNSKNKIHMIGIGGIGMSGLAFILAEMGYKMSGSDVEENNIIERLRLKGVDISIGHNASCVSDQDFVVYSSSIRMNNPEILAARKKGIPIISRIELLKMVTEKFKRVIAVTGTHGKTTITAMASLLTETAGFDPTVLIGGESPHFAGNAKLGRNKTLVTELDESDGRFIILKPTHIIISNIEKEHVEHYRTESHLVRTFARFLNAQSTKSTFFYRIEDRILRKLAASYKGKIISFGFSKYADVYASNVKVGVFKVEFDCFYKGREIECFTINIPGVHNVLNALAVVSLGISLKVDTNTIKHTLNSYKGVKRRFEVIGDVNGARIVEDYAHHPQEIRATISAAYSLKPKRLISVFQPHRYTRTKSFHKEFSKSFSGSDEVILTEVYPASEDKIKGVSSKSIYDNMVKDGLIPVKLLKKDDIPRYLSKRVRKGDLVLILGAGDIGKTAHKMLELNS